MVTTPRVVWCRDGGGLTGLGLQQLVAGAQVASLSRAEAALAHAALDLDCDGRIAWKVRVGRVPGPAQTRA